MIVGILGSSGFLGLNVGFVLKSNDIKVVAGGRRYDNNSKVDATSVDDIEKWIEVNGITHVVNLAAMCGGIGLNRVHPYKLWSATTRITASVLDACVSKSVEKLVMVGTVCSYAAECPTPFKESYLMNYGMPEETNMAYGISKFNGLIGSQAANKEFGLDVVNLIPVNMYGPYDHFDLDNSHVIPAMINKIDSAISNGSKSVEVWGDGSPSREFLYAEDCSKAILKSLLMDNIGPEFINVGTGEEITIKRLVETLCEVMGFDGDINWNGEKPNGQMRRCLDITRAKSKLGWSPETTLIDGLKKTVKWYREFGDLK